MDKQIITIVEPKYSSILFKTSFLFALNTIYGLYQMMYGRLAFNDVLITNTLLFITSINYWKKPTYGFRRKLDIFMSLTNIIYNSYTISHHPKAWICYISIKMLIVSYGFSWYYYNNNNMNLSTFCHAMVHFFGNFGNFIVLNDFRLFLLF
jgi:hypothetical protein